LALAFRLFLSLSSDNFNHPDEIFQVLEQAHRLVFDYGFIPWEYRLDARSWIVPGLTALFLYPFKLLRIDNPHIYIPGIKIILAMLSLLTVVAAYHIGRKWSSSEHGGLWSAFFCAVWYDIAYFSIKPLSEVWAAFFFMLALWLSLKDNTKYMVLSSFLAILAAAIRINYIPLIFVFLLIKCIVASSKNRIAIVTSALGSIILVAIFEWLTLGRPFISYYNFYTVDKTFFMSGTVGTSISLEYLLFLACSSLFLIWLFIIAGAVFSRALYFPTTLIVVGILSHVFIPAHKHQIDFRHIYLLIPLTMLVGGTVIGRIQRRLKSGHNLFTIIIALAFLTISFTGSLGRLPLQKKIYNGKTLDVHEDTIYKSYDNLKAYLFLHDQEDLRGLYDNTDLWFRSGAYYYLHRDIPVYFYNKKPPGPNFVSHFTTRGERKIIPGFELLKTIGEIDIYRRIDQNFTYPVDTTYNRFIFQPGVDYNDDDIHL
jgi:hypothetical protein